MILNTRHIGIVVSNLNKSLDFYLALGFSINSRQIECGPVVSQIVGIDEVEVETVKLATDTGVSVELLKYHSHPKEGPVKQDSNELGCSHIALTVSDIDMFLECVIQKGGSIVNNPVLTENEEYRVAYCHDPEGVLLEVVEQNL
tara:strand:- start:121 stop:552 length:432 start_codon:yes stop_codon:yes gene_type:complete